MRRISPFQDSLSVRTHASAHRGRRLLVALLVLSLISLGPGCSSTRTVVDDPEAGVRRLELRAGDVIKLITLDRQRFRIEILEIEPDVMRGRVMKSSQSSLSPGSEVTVAYADLALVQVDRFSRWRTAGAVASVAVIGAMIALAAGGVSPTIAAPPP